ncbi:hypothetical protein A3715_15880 [Oleiphilus sp. HI0009]|nr:hypothetical protein A3715_15880 [Oleiphilus sp. HI0009]
MGLLQQLAILEISMFIQKEKITQSVFDEAKSNASKALNDVLSTELGLNKLNNFTAKTLGFKNYHEASKQIQLNKYVPILNTKNDVFTERKKMVSILVESHFQYFIQNIDISALYAELTNIEEGVENSGSELSRRLNKVIPLTKLLCKDLENSLLEKSLNEKIGDRTRLDVFCEIGGDIFGAIYFRRRIKSLNPQNSAKLMSDRSQLGIRELQEDGMRLYIHYVVFKSISLMIDENEHGKMKSTNKSEKELALDFKKIVLCVVENAISDPNYLEVEEIDQIFFG